MTGTVLDVDTAVYYDTAGKIAAGAQAWWAAIDARWPEIAKAVDMAGSYDDGREWGKSYDTRAAEILKMVTRVASATHAYAIVLNNLGYQRALDEHGATIDAGPAPGKPTAPMYPVLNCRVPLPSAGGPGNGLVDEGLGLVAKIGITVPDGNATTISNAAVTWDAARTATEVAGFPAILEAAAIAFEAVAAPEVEFVDEDLRALKAAAAATLTAMGDLAQSCRDHRIALDELRELLKKQLEMVRDALIQELAITAAISVASSFITFGAGAAIGLAGAAAICARYARPMRLIIQEWRTNRGISAGVKLDADLARHVRECERLEDLGPAGRLKPKADPPPKPELIELGPIPHPPGIPKVELSQAERDAITKYTGNSYDINSALRSGDELTVAQRAEVEQLNTTLDKLPTFEGAVTRRTDLDADVLAKYERGAEVTEAAFTSSSATAKAAKDLPVEFQIWSETGRYVGHHSTAPQELEVLFKSGTPFRVVDRFEVDGRTIIQMREMPR